MPDKCSVPGCKTGYDTELRNRPAGKPKPTMHLFPSHDKTLLSLWVEILQLKPRNPLCGEWTPSKRSKICSLHFQSSDFIESSIDENTTRTKGGTIARKLKRRYENFYNFVSEGLDWTTEIYTALTDSQKLDCRSQLQTATTLCFQPAVVKRFWCFLVQKFRNW